MKKSKICLFLTILLFALTASTLAQVPFTKSVIDDSFAVNSHPADLEIADLNGDEKMDIVVSSPDDFTGENSVFLWYQNDDNETFYINVIDTVILGGGSFDIADIDDDLDNDIVLAASDQVSWYDNDGNGNFLKNMVFLLGHPRSPVIIDLDMDFDMDIVCSNNIGIFWANNNGSLSFTKDTVDMITINDPTLFVADIDKDADNDVIAHVHIDSTDMDMLVLYRNDGDENFTMVPIDTNTQNVRSIVVDDLDNDMENDIILIDGRDAGNFIFWYQNDGTENFVIDTVSDDFNRLPMSLSVADIDGDEDKDVLVTGGNSSVGEVVYYENDGSENFSKQTIDDSPGNRKKLAVIDFDNDTDLDLFVINNFPDEVIYYQNDTPLIENIEYATEIAPNDFYLWQNYPNPFNPNTVIGWELPYSGLVELSIYNILGEKVTTLVSEQLSTGYHEIEFNARNLSSGVYFYRIRVADLQTRAVEFWDVGKMILIK